MSKRGNSEGSIYRRKDGRWAAVVSIGYHGGKRKRKTFYGQTRRDVQEQLKAALRDQQLGLPVATDRQTLSQFLDEWLETVVKPRTRYSTHSSYSRLVRKHIAPELGRLQLVKVGPKEIQGLIVRKGEQGLSPRTCQYLRAILSSAFATALKWGLVHRNPATLVDPPKQRRPRIRPMSPDEARRLLAAVQGHRLEALYTVALAIGLRIGEALGLLWDDVDFERGTLSVKRALQRVDGKLQFVRPKSERAFRTVYLPRVAVEALQEHRKRQETEKLVAGSRWVENELVFPSSIGTPADARNVTRHFHECLAVAGLERQRLHDLRHACASFLLAQGVNPRTVMEILGHSQISLTLDTYSHLLPAVMSDAASKMDGVLEPSAPSSWEHRKPS